LPPRVFPGCLIGNISLNPEFLLQGKELLFQVPPAFPVDGLIPRFQNEFPLPEFSRLNPYANFFTLAPELLIGHLVMKVLIIEQEKTFLQSLLNYLEHQKKFDVSWAYSGKEAVSLWQNGLFDMVLCSQRLPDGNGLETLKTLIQQKPGAVSILMTAVHDEILKQQAIKAGIGGYLEKPFNLQQLEEVMGITHP
jgi:CheY-like chemotaxis protein